MINKNQFKNMIYRAIDDFIRLHNNSKIFSKENEYDKTKLKFANDLIFNNKICQVTISDKCFDCKYFIQYYPHDQYLKLNYLSKKENLSLSCGFYLDKNLNFIRYDKIIVPKNIDNLIMDTIKNEFLKTNHANKWLEYKSNLKYISTNYMDNIFTAFLSELNSKLSYNYKIECDLNNKTLKFQHQTIKKIPSNIYSNIYKECNNNDK